MRALSCSFGLLLAAAPLGARAQTGEPTAPPVYVGLAAYASNYLPLGQTWRGGFPVPLQATAGYRFTPRWALQVGAAYSGRGNTYEGTDYRYVAPGTYLPYAYSGQYWQRLFTASVLGRYTLTRQASHRLQFDALAGLAFVHTRNSSSSSRLDSAAVATTESYSYCTNNLLLNAGLGVRYRLAPRLEATYNFLLGVPLTGYNLGGPHPSMALGLQYQLGRR